MKKYSKKLKMVLSFLFSHLSFYFPLRLPNRWIDGNAKIKHHSSGKGEAFILNGNPFFYDRLYIKFYFTFVFYQSPRVQYAQTLLDIYVYISHHMTHNQIVCVSV